MQFKRLAASVTAIVALASSGVVYASHAVRASDHQDSPAVLSRVGADITDDYLFPSPTRPGYVDFVMNVHPFIPAGMSQYFGLDPDVLYQFKISHGPIGSAAPADSELQILASGSGPRQQVAVYGKRGHVPLGNPSTLGEPLGTFAFNNPSGARLKDGIVAFAGPRADSFFFDLLQFFTWLPDRNFSNPRTGDKIVFGNGAPTFNGFAPGTRSGPAWGNYLCNTAPSTNFLTETNGGFNVISIVVEIPKSLLVAPGQSPIIHLWSTASVAAGQINHQVAYDQIELFARPGEKELFEVFGEHANTNEAEPFNDPHIRAALEHFTRVAHRSEAIAKVIQAVLYPDELAADLSQTGPAAYLGVETGGATGSKFGGRSLTNDGIDAALGAVFGNTIPALGLAPDDHNENACLSAQNVVSGQGGVQTQPQFPYLATPH